MQTTGMLCEELGSKGWVDRTINKGNVTSQLRNIDRLASRSCLRLRYALLVKCAGEEIGKASWHLKYLFIYRYGEACSHILFYLCKFFNTWGLRDLFGQLLTFITLSYNFESLVKYWSIYLCWCFIPRST